MKHMILTAIFIASFIFLFGTIGAMECETLTMLSGTIRCAVLLGVAGITGYKAKLFL